MVRVRPYGLQREMLMLAARDAEGQPVQHTYGNIHELIRIRGPLDVARLAEAARDAVAGMDVSGLRFRHADGEDWLVADDGPPRSAFERCAGVDDVAEFGGSALRVAMLRTVETARHLRHEPLIRLLVGDVGLDDRLLLLSLDHSVGDGRTISLLVRDLVHRYQGMVGGAGRTGRAGGLPSFLAVAREAADPAPQDRARRFWSAVLDAAADPAARPRFPGGRWKPRSDRVLTGVAETEIPDGEAVALQRVADRMGTVPQHVCLAATAFVVSCWAERFVPINYMRHGRSERARVAVPGPLAEHAVTLEPIGEQPTIGGWAQGFVRRNSTAPPMAGLSLRELESALSDENRMVIFNFLPSARPVRFAGTVFEPAGEIARLVESGDRSSRFGVRVLLWRYPGHALRLAVHHDPEVLPDGDAMAAAVRRVLTAVAVDSRRPVCAVRRAVRRVWEE